MTWYLWAMIFAGLALALAYQRGRKVNLALIHRVSEALERAFEPDDKLYTWIGGLVGFHAKYHFESGPVERIEATVTLLPRHSPLFMPISWLLFRSDRLFLTAFLREPLRGEWHVMTRSRLRRLSRELSARNLEQQDFPEPVEGDFLLLAPRNGQGERAGEGPDDLASALARLVASQGPAARRLVHLALVPDRHTVFLFHRGLDSVEAAARLLLAVVSLVGAASDD